MALPPVANVHEILACSFLQFTYVSSVLTSKWCQNRVLINKKYSNAPARSCSLSHHPQSRRNAAFVSNQQKLFLHFCLENPHLSLPRRKVGDIYDVVMKNKQVIWVTEDEVKTLACAKCKRKKRARCKSQGHDHRISFGVCKLNTSSFDQQIRYEAHDEAKTFPESAACTWNWTDIRFVFLQLGSKKKKRRRKDIKSLIEGTESELVHVRHKHTSCLVSLSAHMFNTRPVFPKELHLVLV